MADARAAELIDAYLDGELDAAGHAELMGLVNADPSVAAMFALASFDDRRMRDELVGRRADGPIEMLEPVLVPSPVATQRSASSMWYVPVAAALVFLALGALAVYVWVISVTGPAEAPVAPRSSVPVATVIDAQGDVIIGDDLAVAGFDYPARTVRVGNGSTELQLTSGANLQISDRGEITIHNKLHSTLAAGFARFSCPPSAHGYTVDLPGNARVVDLGTRFDIRIDPTGTTRIFVSEGAVVARSADGHEIGIPAGRAVAIADSGAFVDIAQLDAVRTARFSRWSFDESEGPALVDSGVGFDAPHDGELAWGPRGHMGAERVDGPAGRALRFDGINDYVATDHPGVAGAAPRTVAMWVRIPSNAKAKDALALFGYGEFKPARVWQMSWNSYSKDGPLGALRLGVLGDQIIAKTDLRDGQWHHIAATYDGKTARLYIDGELEATKAMRINTAIGTGASPVTIGRNVAKHADVYFRGMIDEAYIVDHALRNEQIYRLMKRSSTESNE